MSARAKRYWNKGFVQVPREVLDSPMWKRQHDEKQFSVRDMRMYLTLRANWAPAKVQVGKRTVHVPTAGIFTSQVKVEDDTGWDRKKFRAFLRREAGADRLSFETKWGRRSGYTLIILKDIWGLHADFKWGEVTDDEGAVTPVSPFNSPFSPHIQDSREVSTIAGNNSYVGISGSENGSGLGSGNGFSKSARAGIVEVEKAFIGCLLTDESIAPELIAAVTPEDFLSAPTARTYDCILALLNRSEPITLIALDEEFRRRDIAQPSASEIAEWAQDVKLSLARFYAESIRRASDARHSEVQDHE